MYKRIIEQQIIDDLFKGKVIVLYGPRRVGKTTLVKKILENYPDGKYINCELLTNRQVLETRDHIKLKEFFGKSTLVVLDEAQSINSIGVVLKILVDTYPDLQIIATGSSSFDLAHQVSESLTGRANRYMLYPFSVDELRSKHDLKHNPVFLEKMLRFGTYPSVFVEGEDEAIRNLDEISNNYLYKDVLNLEGLKRPDLVGKLLQAIALQVGSEVSYREIANLLSENHKTIQRYIEILEQGFVIFRLKTLSRNPRKELGKKQKIYFYDLGIRNSIIQNYNPLHLRNDTSALWENFCIVERMKFNKYGRKFLNTYFWRSYSQREIDYIEEYGGGFYAYEFKYGDKKQVKLPGEFAGNYENARIEVVNKENYLDFLSEA